MRCEYCNREDLPFERAEVAGREFLLCFACGERLERKDLLLQTMLTLRANAAPKEAADASR
jgi:hypothetical protein